MAAKGNDAFHMNELLNGIPLAAIQHNGSHALYNEKVRLKLLNTFSSCVSFKATKYFHIEENSIEKYHGVFVKYQNGDPNYRKIEKLFGSISKKDTVSEIYEITFRSIFIEGHKVLYPTDTKDTSKGNPKKSQADL